MLESLHDRRVAVTSMFVQAVTDAKARRVDVTLKSGIDDLHQLVIERMKHLRCKTDLGSNLDSVKSLFDATLVLQCDASSLEGLCITRANASQGTNLSDLAGSLLKDVAAYCKMIEQR